MRKIIFLIPVFNDWESLKKLIAEINSNINDFTDFEYECVIINDASTSNQPKFSKPENFGSLKILNMKRNKGHARSNAFGIRYVYQNIKFDYLILMDGDGEDRPEEIKNLINKILVDKNKSIVAKRVKRSEGFFFQFLYFMHKLITFVFTGKKINFGNYSCLTFSDVEKLHSKASLWSSYSGTLKKNLLSFNEIDSIRGIRYFGPSKMSFYNLLIHSFSIIAVFKNQVFLRSIIFVLIMFYMNIKLITNFVIILIFIFNIIILLVSLREKKDELLSSQENLKDANEILH